VLLDRWAFRTSFFQPTWRRDAPVVFRLCGDEGVAAPTRKQSYRLLARVARASRP